MAVSWHQAFRWLSAGSWFATMFVAVFPLRFSWRVSACLGAVLACALGKFFFFSLRGGDFSPDLPEAVITFYSGFFAAALFFLLFSVLAAVWDGVAWCCHRPVPLTVRRRRAAVLAILAILAAVWGMYEAVCLPRVVRVTFAWRELPPAFDGYRIVQISDLHCSSAARRARFEGIVRRINALAPDLVAITGDFVDGWPADRQADLAPLADLRARDGVVGCTGNHESYWDWAGWHDVFRTWNIRILDETGPVTVSRGADALAFGGVKDPHFFRRTPAESDACRAFDGTPPGAFRVLLFHRPLPAWANATAANVRLHLAGHTHGGAMPGIHWFVAAENDGHTRGRYDFAPGRILYVSPGTGQWCGFPLRLFNPAEITEITLRRER